MSAEEVASSSIAAASGQRSPAGGAGLGRQAVGLLGDPLGYGGGIFRVAAGEIARALHLRDHGAKVGFEEIERLADAVEGGRCRGLGLDFGLGRVDGRFVGASGAS